MTTNENFKELLKFIDERLQKKHESELELVRKHNAEAMNKDWEIPEDELWEQSDVVHDFLAFLAEQMIEMNKQKQSEIRGFTNWLEREISAKLYVLSNKTVIEEYHENNFEKLIEVLKKNKKKIPINLSNRDFQMNFEDEFNKSRAKLNPLMKKIESTDKLIDQIVYKLYGLTEEEIKIVEESIGKK